MTEINPALYNNQPDTTTTEGARKSLANDFDNFLTLLTTQMQNQDPLSPMESTEFTNQLVQFASVEQQLAQTEELEGQTDILRATRSNTALDYIGNNVEIKGRQFNFEGREVNFTVDMPEASREANVFILDANGRAVFQHTGPLTQGSRVFNWDGTTLDGREAEPGTYTVEVQATNEDGDQISAETFVPGRVDGVQTVNGGTELIIGDIAVPIEDVRAAIDPNSLARAQAAASTNPPRDGRAQP